MPTPYSSGMRAAHVAFGAFAEGDASIGLVASGTGAGVVTGLGFTPDWVIFGVTDEVDNNTLSWTATSTTLTITGRSTTTAQTISYICGNIS